MRLKPRQDRNAAKAAKIVAITSKTVEIFAVRSVETSFISEFAANHKLGRENATLR